MNARVGAVAENKCGGIGTEKLHVLVFSVMGIRFGVDTEQVARVVNLSHLEGEEENVVMFDEEFPFPGREVVYEAPKVLCLQDSRKLVVDEIEEVRFLSFHSIRSMPELLEKYGESGAVWGAGIVEGGIILLLNLLR